MSWYDGTNVYYNDVIMSTMASQIISLMIVYSTVYSGADQRKHQRSASLAFVNSPHKRPVTWKMFPFDDVIMIFAAGESLDICSAPSNSEQMRHNVEQVLQFMARRRIRMHHTTANGKWQNCDFMIWWRFVILQWRWFRNVSAENFLTKLQLHCTWKFQVQYDRPISQMPKCICVISHNAIFCNMRAHFCYKMVHCGIFVWRIEGFVRWVYCRFC